MVISWKTLFLRNILNLIKISILFFSSLRCCFRQKEGEARMTIFFWSWFGQVNWIWIRLRRRWWCWPNRSMMRISRVDLSMKEKILGSCSRESSLYKEEETLWGLKVINLRKILRLRVRLIKKEKRSNMIGLRKGRIFLKISGLVQLSASCRGWREKNKRW